MKNPGIEELMAVFDEAEALVRDGRNPGGC